MKNEVFEVDETAQNFKAAMRNYPATVCVLTMHLNGRDHGMTATAVTSVSMDPPSLLVCLNNRTLLHEMLKEGDSFAVNVLGAGSSAVSNAFSGGVAPEKRFGDGLWTRDDAGMLILNDASANFICQRQAALPFGTHTMFVGEVLDVKCRTDLGPLIYAGAGYCETQPVAQS